MRHPRWLTLLSGPVGPIVAARTTRPWIGLTFDDGPEPGTTERILEVLGAQQARATFFVLAQRARAHASLLNEISAAGHELALHGLDHRRLSGLPRPEVNDLLRRGQDLVGEVSGIRPRFFRPAYGAMDRTTWLAARELGMETVLWGPSLWDWRPAREQDRIARATEGLRGGSIVLGHDGTAGTADGADEAQPPAIDRPLWVATVLEHYRARGLTATTLGQLFQHGRPERSARLVLRRP